MRDWAWYCWSLGLKLEGLQKQRPTLTLCFLRKKKAIILSGFCGQGQGRYPHWRAQLIALLVTHQLISLDGCILSNFSLNALTLPPPQLPQPQERFSGCTLALNQQIFSFKFVESTLLC